MLISPSAVLAKKLTGSVELSYQRDKAVDSGSKTQRTTFTQDYKVEYKSFLYTPRFLNYKIDGQFKRDISKDISDFASSGARSDSPSLNFRLNFLEGTRYPVSFYKERLTGMTDSTSGTSSTITRTKTDRYGTYGSYRFNRSSLKMKYDLRQERTTATSTSDTGGGSLSQVSSGNYAFGIERSFDAGKVKNAVNANANYNYSHTKNKVTNEFDGNHSFDASIAGIKPTKNSDFNMNANYSHINPSQMTTYTGNLYYNYIKSSNFTVNSSMYLNQMVDKNTNVNYSTLYLNSRYQISDNLNSSQNITLFRKLGTGSETNESGTVSIGYTKSIYGFGVYANSSVFASSMQKSSESHTNTRTYNLNTGFSRTVPVKTAQVSFRGSYAMGGGHPASRSKTYSLGTGASLRLIKNMNFQTALDVTESEVYTSSSSSLTKSASSTNSLSYTVPLGLKGAVNITFGANFTEGNLPTSTYSSNLNLSYILLRGLVLRSDLAYNEDTRAEAITKSVGMNLGYERKQFRLSFDNRFAQISDHNNVKFNVSTALRATRTF
ncbi:MAG: hypothetical protein HQL10_13010 [Nitrospirae bacterium]|nr:hypothetical protein [Nitrospirota bacterium]